MQKNQKTNYMKAKLFIIACVAGFVLAACKSPKVAGIRDEVAFNFVGTAWQMHQQVIGLDAAPTITSDYILRFVDKSKVELERLEDYSSYSGTVIRNDGTVEHHPGHVERNIKTGKYTVKGNVVSITMKDDYSDEDKTKEYLLRKDYLIYDISEEEYDALPEFQRDFYTYKRINFEKP